MRANSHNTELDTWTYTADLVLTCRRAHVEVVFADLQRKYGGDLEPAKFASQHRGSWGCAAGSPRGSLRCAPVSPGFPGVGGWGGKGDLPERSDSGHPLTSAAAGGIEALSTQSVHQPLLRSRNATPETWVSVERIA
jgi:hypothetical protein